MIGMVRVQTPAFGAWGLTDDDLVRYAAAAIAKARQGVPLSSLRAELAPTQMLTPPTNAVGAYLHVAYWFAQGARPTTPGGPQNGRLLAAADAALANASAGSGFSLFSVTSDVTQAAKVLTTAVETAEAAGRRDVAAILWSLREDAAEAPPEAWYADPAGRFKAFAATGTVVTVVGALAAGGVLLWLAKPYADVAATAIKKL